MKKKLFLLLISTTLVLSACGSDSTTETATSAEVVSETTATENAAEISDDLSDLEALGDVEVDEGLFDVELTIPKDYVGETTQENLDALAAEKGFKSITLNPDGSATYIMTKKTAQNYDG